MVKVYKIPFISMIGKNQQPIFTGKKSICISGNIEHGVLNSGRSVNQLTVVITAIIY